MKKIFLSYASLIIGLSSCQKFVDVEAPVTSVTSESIYTTDATAAAVLTGIYTQMGIGPRDMSVRMGLSADELTLYQISNVSYLKFYTNTLTNDPNLTFWETFYKFLQPINSAIEGLNNSTSLTPSVKQQLLGEAKFLRAYFHFYLVNLYGDVPLIISSDYRTNKSLERTLKIIIYNQIVADLKDAQSLLNNGYLDATILNQTSERARPNKWAATALLARAYLFMADYPNAEIQSSLIISNSAQYGLTTLAKVFLKASLSNNEAIWQLQPVNSGWNTEEARIFILPSSGPTSTSSTYPVFLSNFLMNSFENGDQRKSNWVNNVVVGSNTFYYSYKYKSATLNAPVNEYSTILRLAEQYLIRAECRAQLNNISGSQADLNSIRLRAGLANTLANDKASLLNAIMHERQVEFFCELGQRWLDLKRSGIIDATMNVVTPAKGGIWNTNAQLYPIPLFDLQQNSSLSQNPGY